MKRMLKALLTLALALAVTLAIGSSSLCAAMEPDLPEDNYSGYLVILNPSPAPQGGDVSLFSAYFDEVPERLTLLNGQASVYKAAQLSDIADLVYAGRVALAEPDYEVELFDVTPTPNDEFFTDTINQYQYYLKNADSGIRVQAAWDAGLSGDGVTVAVIDSGLNDAHLDAPAKLGIGRYYYYREYNPNDPDDVKNAADFQYTFNGANGKPLTDASGNVKRYGYYSSSDYTDNVGHGTAVSGIIAAKCNNKDLDGYPGGGVAGIAPNVTIIPIRCFTNTPGHLGGYSSNMISALEYAVAQGADVINMSWGLKTESQSLRAAINAAANAGCILVAAAGNDGNSAVNYPAAYENVIGVGSTEKALDANNKLVVADFSQRNSTVDIFAPGRTIYSLGISTRTAVASGSGTSFSAPQVSAVAALLREAKPTMTHSEFAHLLTNHSSPLGQTLDYLGGKKVGFLNVQKLLDATGSAVLNVTNSGGVCAVQACYHPAASAETAGDDGLPAALPLTPAVPFADSNCVILLAAYNAKGHLVGTATAASGGAFQAASRTSYGGYRVSASFARSDVTDDISSVRAFFLKSSDGSLASILSPLAKTIQAPPSAS